MRRIIQGKAYDTQTAKHVASDSYINVDEYHVIEALYQTPGGAFFMLKRVFGQDLTGNGDQIAHEHWSACSREQAEHWFREGSAVELFDETVFAAPDEAAAEDDQEKLVTFTLRMSETLRDKLAAAAKSDGLSLNKYLVRCVQDRLPGTKAEFGNSAKLETLANSTRPSGAAAAATTVAGYIRARWWGDGERDFSVIGAEIARQFPNSRAARLPNGYISWYGPKKH